MEERTIVPLITREAGGVAYMHPYACSVHSHGLWA